MIPRDFITEWRAHAPWVTDVQVEQDLVICRVQIEAGPIGPVLKEVRAALDAWLGVPSWKQSEGRVALNYRFRSEDIPPLGMRLKVEINSREHFTVMGHETAPFEVASRWFTGRADVPTFALDELLGTKLRALYQRKGEQVSRTMFEQNLAEKRGDPVFTADIGPLLAAGASWELERAFESVLGQLVALLPGAPWRGGKARP